MNKTMTTKLVDFEESAPVGSMARCDKDDGDVTGVFEISVPVLGSMTRCEQDDGDETGGVEKSAPV